MNQPEYYVPVVFENSISDNDLRKIKTGIKIAQLDALREGREEFTDITHRNYEATKRRGLILSGTSQWDFIRKIREETDEFNDDWADWSELADITLVCFAMAEHYGIDLIEEMRKKTEFNETRV